MTEPYFQRDLVTLYVGDCRDVLRELPDESVHCVVTSWLADWDGAAC